MSPRAAQRAMTTPTMPPTIESSTVSVSSWRVIRQVLAPIAVRVAISLRRPLARARIRFATFAHAIISTRPTNDMNTATNLGMNSATSPGSGRAFSSG